MSVDATRESTKTRPPFRQIAVPAVLASAGVGHLINAVDGALWGLVASMGAVAVIALAIGSIRHQRLTGRAWRQ
ncbi:MAG: hypothetical protein AAF577_13195 [Pseudomonadota bacterium]